MVPGTGIEPVRPLCREAADFKSDVSTNFTTRARACIVRLKLDQRHRGRALPFRLRPARRLLEQCGPADRRSDHEDAVALFGNRNRLGGHHDAIAG